MTGRIEAAALSTSSNLAGGCGRNGDREFARFVLIALGSATELETQLDDCARRGQLSMQEFDPLRTDLRILPSMLGGLWRRLRIAIAKSEERKARGG